ncbi:MAG: protein tyrosine phosphatase [Pirellulaceae bacterium]
MNILFVCSKNQWRSPTAEKVYERHAEINVRSGGTASSARHRVSLSDIQWADCICVMEQKHKQRLLADFSQALARKSLHVLDIPDEYKFMDPELVSLIQSAVDPLLNA